ncbi:MAG: class I SAM-dependent methyltransferase [Dehalococcoidia bacterium]|nr:class I SAM-dependent methyltransferase [Dehalococcoidia bacterium]
MAQDEYFAANRANWDDRAAIHVTSRMYDVEGFVAGTRVMGASNRQEDIDGVGDVAGKTLLHLQCHIGLDTLTWARRGARVTGLDLSPRSIAAARELAERTELTDARFVEANVYDACEALGGEQFDVVFTGVGALNWLPDVRRWAAVVGRLVKPGGVFYMREFHPMTATLDDEDPEGRLVVRYPYFETEQPQAWDDAVTYTDNPARAEHHQHAQLRVEPRPGRGGDGADRQRACASSSCGSTTGASPGCCRGWWRTARAAGCCPRAASGCR